MDANSEDWFTENSSPIHKKNSKVDLEKWLIEPKTRGPEPL